MARSYRFTTSNPPADLNARRTFPAAASSQLMFADFSYDGMFGLPTSGFSFDVDRARGAMTGRNVGGQTRLFIHGYQQGPYPLIELTPPATMHATYAAATSASAAGRAAIVNQWGTAIYGADPAETWKDLGGNAMDLQTALCCIDDDTILYGMQQSYNSTNQLDRVVGMAKLDSPSVGQVTAYGPWRIAQGPHFVGGYLSAIPQGVADAYFGGRRIATGSPALSGTNSSAFGCNFLTFAKPSTSLPPSSRTDNTDIAFAATIEARHDSTHRQDLSALGLSRKICDWADPGNHATTTGVITSGAVTIPVSDTALYLQAGSLEPDQVTYPGQYYAYLSTSTTPSGSKIHYTGRSGSSGAGTLTGVTGVVATWGAGTRVLLGNYDSGRGGVLHNTDGTWGPVREGSTDVGTYFDYMNQLLVLQTAGGKTGALFLATLPDTVSGVDYSPDTIAHIWYGAGTQCVHGQTNEQNTTITGPQTTSTVPWAFLYRLSDLADVRLGLKTLAQLLPADAMRLDTFGGGTGIPSPVAGRIPNGMFFDSVTGKLYLCVKNQDAGASIPLYFMPLFHRFSVH